MSFIGFVIRTQKKSLCAFAAAGLICGLGLAQTMAPVSSAGTASGLSSGAAVGATSSGSTTNVGTANAAPVGAPATAGLTAGRTLTEPVQTSNRLCMACGAIVEQGEVGVSGTPPG